MSQQLQIEPALVVSCTTEVTKRLRIRPLGLQFPRLSNASVSESRTSVGLAK